jgi:Membrane bound O-acyl transferase family
MAVIIYKCIVQRRRQTTIVTTTTKTSSSTIQQQQQPPQKQYSNQYTLPIDSYILGWGVILPLSILFPYQLLNVLYLQNKVIRMALASTAFIVGFRCIEAMYHTSPPTVERNLYTYMIYYSSLLHYEWDPVTGTRRRITVRELLYNCVGFLFTMALLSIVLSMEMYYNFQPFSNSPVQLHEYHFNFELLLPSHIGNMYGLAVLTYFTLAFGLGITGIGEQVKGYYTAPIFDHPLWTSRSPSEFWGVKWNRMIHTLLKYGTFRPARQFMSKRMAILVTFIVSGIIHEYVWTLLFYQYPNGTIPDASNASTQHVPVVWKLTLFFVWNGVVMLLERPVAPYVQHMTSKLPTWIVSTLVVWTALPVSHWYTGDWVVGGYFHDLSIGLWMVRKQ